MIGPRHADRRKRFGQFAAASIIGQVEVDDLHGAQFLVATLGLELRQGVRSAGTAMAASLSPAICGDVRLPLAVSLALDGRSVFFRVGLPAGLRIWSAPICKNDEPCRHGKCSEQDQAAE